MERSRTGWADREARPLDVRSWTQNQVGANAQTNTVQWRVIGEIQDGMKDQAETNGRIDERTKLILDTLNSMK